MKPRIEGLAVPAIVLALLLTACAETDPYKRLEPAPTPAMETKQAAEAFNARWPKRFKAVQTVTIDFRVKTMTMVGYLIVQGDSFRLQGMTEQGMKLLDIACHEGRTRTVFAADEFDDMVISSISRDIERVFIERWDANQVVDTDSDEVMLEFWSGDVETDERGVTAYWQVRQGEIPIRLTGTPPLVDWYKYNRDSRNLYRVDHYEWREFGDHFAPSVVVLRERGVVSNGPSYKLTIKLTELETREQPWPESIFIPEDE